MENNTANVNQENGAPAGKKGLPAYIILGIIALVAACLLYTSLWGEPVF